MIKVKLTDHASTEVTLRAPWVRADSIGGSTDADPSWSAPLSSVSELKTKRFNVWLTSGLVAGSLAVALGGFVLICLAAGCDKG